MRRLIPIVAAMVFASPASAQVQTQPAAPKLSDHVAADTRAARDPAKAEADAPAQPQNNATRDNPSFTVFSPASVYWASRDCFRECRP